MRRRLSALFVVAGIALSGSAGCVVRTGPALRGGHSDRSSERHCHERGRNHNLVCHAHPHGPGHHG